MGIFLLLALAVLAIASLYVQQRYSHRIYSVSAVPSSPVAIVFGAGLVANGQPSPILADRLETAIVLYKAGKTKKLLVSGDNFLRYHDETRAMKRYLVDRGVPVKDIVSDFAGLSTYDTCYRAKEVFGVDRAILVTQRFHMPRALYIATSMGILADGVPANEQRKVRLTYVVREILSRSLAIVMVVVRPRPHFIGDKQPITAS
jgi:SanA protein